MNQSNRISGNLHLKMLGAVVEFMTRSGVTEAEIRRSLDQGIADVRSKLAASARKSEAATEVGNLAVSAELLRLWHRDGRYLNRDAKPRPLFLSKGRDSLRLAI